MTLFQKGGKVVTQMGVWSHFKTYLWDKDEGDGQNFGKMGNP